MNEIPRDRTVSRLVLTDRDRQIFHAVWSAGALDAATIRWAINPNVSQPAISLRLTKLARHGYLSAKLVPSQTGGSRWLYTLGPKAVPQGTRVWSPSLNQLDHTLAIGRVLSRLLYPGLAAPCEVIWWEGEIEIRSNASGEQPLPDLRVFWQSAGREGAWAIEVDRSTESHPVWRRKMVRYLGGPEQILAITFSRARANGLVAVGREVGVDLIATTEALLRESLDPPVLSARLDARVPLSQATLGSTVLGPQGVPSSGHSA